LPAKYVLIDFENIQPATVAPLAGGAFNVRIFVGPSQARGRISFELSRSVQMLGVNAEYVTVARSGPNAIDMHIAYYIGALLQKEPKAAIHIISADTDFDALIDSLRAVGYSVERTKSIGNVVRRGKGATVTDNVKAKVKVTDRADPKPLRQSEEDTLAPIIKQLRSMSGKPSTRKKLGQTIVSFLQQRGRTAGEDTVAQIIDELIRRNLVSQNGAKVSYQLS
jgi:hypothetical protein